MSVKIHRAQFQKMHYGEHWFVLVENGQVIKVEQRRRKARPWVFSILTIGLFYHLFASGNRLRYYFSFSKARKTIRLVYALSTRDSGKENIRAGFEYLEGHARRCGAEIIETVIVNPFIKTSMLLRRGWVYKGRSKFLWRIFHYPINSNDER